jgi:hypothetical protein
MVKKYSLAILAVILTGALVVGVASAVETQFGEAAIDAEHPRRLLIGQVTGLGDNQFEIKSLKGDSHTILVTGETVYRHRASQEEIEDGSEALEVGGWVGILNHRDAEGQISARLVVLLPEDFDPDEFRGVRAAGEVDKINNGQATFTIITKAGKELTFSVGDETRFAGGLADFNDLEKGDLVAVLAREQSDGSLLAKQVGTRRQDRPPQAKFTGKISDLDTASLTIITRAGDELTFSVTEATRFGSRTGKIEGIDDLEIDMVVAVVTRPSSQDEALGVLVLDPALLHLSRVRGEIQSAGGDHLTLIVGDDTLTFTVDENTRIKGRGIHDLNDLKNGMNAGVLFLMEEDGTFLAKGILA